MIRNYHELGWTVAPSGVERLVVVLLRQVRVVRTLSPLRPSAQICPAWGANLHAGLGDFRARVSFRKTARVPQFCGLFVLIGIGPDKQCPMKLGRFPFNGRVRPPLQPFARRRSGRSRLL